LRIYLALKDHIFTIIDLYFPKILPLISENSFSVLTTSELCCTTILKEKKKMSTIAIEVRLNSYNRDSDHTMNQVLFDSIRTIFPNNMKKISTITIEAQLS
jgi:hypothetical protein